MFLLEDNLKTKIIAKEMYIFTFIYALALFQKKNLR